MTRADAEEVCQLSISIRTPAWGVTSEPFSKLFLRQFQFAPPRGGVTTPVPRLADLINFNSHPRVGGDWYKDFFGIRYSISIRTPAWGVTDTAAV